MLMGMVVDKHASSSQPSSPAPKAVKEILLAGDANRLVAELTFVFWMARAVVFQASELCFDNATSIERFAEEF